MFGAIAKSYYAKLLEKEPKDIFCVSVMPCVAKKYDAGTTEASDVTDHDVDVVPTTRDWTGCPGHADQRGCPARRGLDSPLGRGSGAGGFIFGVTGGAQRRAALRTAYAKLTGENPADAFREIRGQKPWRSPPSTSGTSPCAWAVVSGLAGARQLMDAIRARQVSYDFVEVMACPGGCSGGGGQPIHEGRISTADRGRNLYQLDKNSTIRFSHENPLRPGPLQRVPGRAALRSCPTIFCTPTRRPGRCNLTSG